MKKELKFFKSWIQAGQGLVVKSKDNWKRDLEAQGQSYYPISD